MKIRGQTLPRIEIPLLTRHDPGRNAVARAPGDRLPPGGAHWIADDRDRPPGVQWFALYVQDRMVQAAAQRAWGCAAWPLLDGLVHDDRWTCHALAALNAALLEGRDDDAAAEHLLSTLSRLLHRHARPAPRDTWRARRIALL